MLYAGCECSQENGKKLISDGAEESASSLSIKDTLFELSMGIAGGAMEYFALEEMDAAEVIDYICLMREKGKRASSGADGTEEKQVKRKVYADQANWH